MDIEKGVLERIVPAADEQRRIDRAVAELTSRVKKIARERGLPYEPVLVGSIAKGTHLTDPDIDLFLRFPPDVAKEDIGRIDKQIGREILERPEERYAEHAYISGIWQGFKTDLVPCYAVTSGRGRISAVDRTPFHTEYVQKHLRSEQQNEVRLLKRFAKGAGAYGAEARTQGFSGYLCELLILKFENFAKLVASARKLKAPVELWIEDKASKKFDEGFVFVDPVDPARNVASPVSPDTLQLFVEACRGYYREPSERYFFPKEREPFDDATAKREIEVHPGTVLVELPELGVVDDILWPQLRKTGVSIQEILGREGFAPRKLTFEADAERNLILVDCETAELQATFIHTGPPEKSPQAANFLEKWKGKGVKEPAVRKGRWQVEVSRKQRTPAAFLAKQLRDVRLGKGFKRIDELTVVSGQKLLQKKYRKALTKHFDERRPWER
jgi:tRNA nucleotidyltransferase (CCA-adding enzyme)